MERDLAIVRDLGGFFDPATSEPQQFQNLLIGSLYLPLYRLTKRYAKPGMSVLDWGSGNGHFSYFLLESGLDVTAFNLQSQKCALAGTLRARYGKRYRICFGADDEPVRLPFGDGSFDMAFSIGVLEHVRESGGSEVASLRELGRVLAPGGLFVCGMLPKRYSWIEFLVRNFFKQKYFHVVRYTKPEIIGLLDQAGFAALEIGTHGFLPRNTLSHVTLAGLENSAAIAKPFNLVDRLLARSLPGIAENFMLCARRRTDASGGRTAS
jgi:SAM-dependent methyltransferase